MLSARAAASVDMVATAWCLPQQQQQHWLKKKTAVPSGAVFTRAVSLFLSLVFESTSFTDKYYDDVALDPSSPGFAAPLVSKLWCSKVGAASSKSLETRPNWVPRKKTQGF